MEITVRKGIPIPTTSHRGKPPKWSPIFDALKVIGEDSYKVTFTTEDQKGREKVLSNIRQAKTAYCKKHPDTDFTIKMVFKNEAMGDLDPEKDGDGVCIWPIEKKAKSAE